LIETLDVPERPSQIVFGGPDHKTMFIAARSSLYSVRLRYVGKCAKIRRRDPSLRSG
jgi:sugar lactone lactonase YvrE